MADTVLVLGGWCTAVAKVAIAVAIGGSMSCAHHQHQKEEPVPVVAPSAAPSVAESPAAVTSSVAPPPSVPVPVPSAARFDAGEPIGLREDDLALSVEYSSGMPVPCEGKPGLMGSPSGTYRVDLVRSTITLEAMSACGGKKSYRGVLTPRARAELRDLVAAMGATPGKGHAPDASRFGVTITRVDGHVAPQGGMEFGDVEHDENAADIAQALNRFLRL